MHVILKKIVVKTVLLLRKVTILLEQAKILKIVLFRIISMPSSAKNFSLHHMYVGDYPLSCGKW